MVSRCDVLLLTAAHVAALASAAAVPGHEWAAPARGSRGSGDSAVFSLATTLRLRGGKMNPLLYPWLNRDEVPDYYAVLGVDEHASSEVIRAAYKRLVLELHPDRTDPPASPPGKGIQACAGGAAGRIHEPSPRPGLAGASKREESETVARFIAVREAWEILGDRDARAAYDYHRRLRTEGVFSDVGRCRDAPETNVQELTKVAARRGGEGSTSSSSTFSFQAHRVGFF